MVTTNTTFKPTGRFQTCPDGFIYNLNNVDDNDPNSQNEMSINITNSRKFTTKEEVEELSEVITMLLNKHYFGE